MISPVYAAEITEVKYGGAEFVEIYSNVTLNLSGNKVYDSSADDKYNTLSLVKNSNSTLYLIVGSNFLEETNISELNCSIYQTDKSQVSNGGLKDTGELVKIEINTTLNISKESYSYPLNYTPCYYDSHTINTTNETQVNTTQDTMICDDTFTIVPKEILTSEKIQFSFSFTGSEQEIEYWIEDLFGNEVRDKKTTLNKNTKSFTPQDKTEVYNISAIANYKNCSYTDSKLVAFYSNKSEDYTKSSIQILNKEELTFLEDDFLDLLIYRNSTETRKSVKIYLNDKLQETLSIDREDTLRKKVDMEFIQGKNTVRVEGLGEEVIWYIFNKEASFQYVEQIQIINTPIKITELSFPYTNYFTVYSQFYSTEEIQGDCVILEGRSYISNRTNISNFTIIRLDLFAEKINTSQLKLSCRYKENNQTSYKYLSQEFNFSKPEEIRVEVNENLDMLFLLNATVRENKSQIVKEEAYYVSRNSKSKERGPWLILLGTIVSFGALFTKTSL